VRGSSREQRGMNWLAQKYMRHAWSGLVRQSLREVHVATHPYGPWSHQFRSRSETFLQQIFEKSLLQRARIKLSIVENYERFISLCGFYYAGSGGPK
jgi:hypothetical protein